MPLPMQGDKLLPCRERVVGRSLRPRPPDRGRGDGLLNSGRGLRKSPPLELGSHGSPIRRAAVGENVDQLAFELGSLGVAEVDCSELLQMLVQQPRVIDDRLQDERLARTDGGATPAMNRARRERRAPPRVALAGEQTRSTWGAPRSRWRIALNPLAPARCGPARVAGADLPLAPHRPLFDLELTPQPLA